MSDSPEMTALELAGYLRRISLTESIPELQALAREIERRFEDDEATPRLRKLIAVKVEGLARTN